MREGHTGHAHGAGRQGKGGNSMEDRHGDSRSQAPDGEHRSGENQRDPGRGDPPPPPDRPCPHCVPMVRIQTSRKVERAWQERRTMGEGMSRDAKGTNAAEGPFKRFLGPSGRNEPERGETRTRTEPSERGDTRERTTRPTGGAGRRSGQEAGQTPPPPLRREADS